MQRIFRKKHKTKEHLDLEQFSMFFVDMFSQDKYIDHKSYTAVLNRFKDTFDKLALYEEDNLLKKYCKSEKHNYKQILTQINQYENLTETVNKHNESFINRKLKEEKKYLDTILKDSDPNIMLDEYQRKIVLNDENNILVVAGAGSGKTTTIEAKVKYLVDKQGINPEEILVVSYTRDATNELKERINKRLGIPAIISTFHSVGNTLIYKDREKPHQIYEQGFLYKVLKKHFLSQKNDATFVKKVLLFFGSYLDAPLDEMETQVLKTILAKDDLTTLRSEMADKLKRFIEKQQSSKRTIRDERVASIQEAQIANFLFINGIDYNYQPIYKHLIKGSVKPYTPDFEISYNGETIFLEHFAISESGKNNRFSKEELEKYKSSINDKIKLHREHKTKLIYTFSKYNDNRDIIKHLEELLNQNGIIPNPRDEKEIYEHLLNNIEDRYFHRFIQLISDFINKIKVNNWNQDKISEFNRYAKDERTKLFLEIAYQCYIVYDESLKSANGIDFEDMINEASNILDKYIETGKKLNYKYVFIDEYQDISFQRFNLAYKLSKASNAKIIAVGDDWQSIFRFAGSDISLFTDFRNHMGYAKELKLINTYRNSQELINVAGNFIQENPNQIKKSLKSPKKIEQPVVLLSYDDSQTYKNNTGPLARMINKVEEALTHIVEEYGEQRNILIIGRYNFDGKNLTRTNKFDFFNNKLTSKLYPKLDITFSTAHSSKGLGFDNVIIINAKDAMLGFPSKIEDDPIMKLVIKENDPLDFAEERRLFYVALTRTKNKVYIIVPENSPSEFVLEIQKSKDSVVLKGKSLTPKERTYKRKCPHCGYPLQTRQNKYRQKKIYLCSNEPEVCGFVTNNLRGGTLEIIKCSKCVDGYLIIKKNKNTEGYFLGCNEYKPNGTGCNNVVDEREFSLNEEKLIFNKEVYTNQKYLDIDVYFIIKSIIEMVTSFNKLFTDNSFHVGIYTSVLLGGSNKTIDAFALNKTEYYGLLNAFHFNQIKNVIYFLCFEQVLAVEKKNGYENLTLSTKSFMEIKPQTMNQFMDSIFKSNN